jgi:hypothetical protein
MKQETRNILETPFTPDQIKQRKGLWGKQLDYIEGHSVIHRLNDAFDSDWSFSVTEHMSMDDEVIVVGRLRVNDVEKQQFGSSNITRDSSTGKMLCLGDDLKGAATDALKKCASLLGVGLHLYGDINNNGNGQTQTDPDQSVNDTDNSLATDNNQRLPGNGNNGNGKNGNGSLITPKQMRYILSLGRRQNMHDNAVEDLAKEWFGEHLSRIGKSEASEMITQLSA